MRAVRGARARTRKRGEGGGLCVANHAFATLGRYSFQHSPNRSYTFVPSKFENLSDWLAFSVGVT